MFKTVHTFSDTEVYADQTESFFIDSIHLQTLSISAGNKLKYKILAEYLL